MIEEYKFGEIKIDGKTYNFDVEVRWIGTLKDKTSSSELEVLKWWRKESHEVCIGDIQRALEEKPEVIVIGSGASGLMEVTEEVKNEVKLKGTELIIDLTKEAIKAFNEICKKSEKEKQKKIIGLFHLTC